LRVLPIASSGAMSRIWMAHRRRSGGPLLQALVASALAQRPA